MRSNDKTMGCSTRVSVECSGVRDPTGEEHFTLVDNSSTLLYFDTRQLMDGGWGRVEER